MPAELVQTSEGESGKQRQIVRSRHTGLSLASTFVCIKHKLHNPWISFDL